MLSPVSEILLEEADAFAPDGRWLVLGGQADLANGLAEIGSEVQWRAIDLRERKRASSGVAIIDDIASATYGRIALPVPPDRALARRWLLTARDALVDDGDLILVGANAEGGKSAVSDARKIFGDVRESYRRKHRIAHATHHREEPDWPAWAYEDGIRPGTWRAFDVAIDGKRVTLETQAGVFAGSRLDAGTKLLLDHLRVEQGERVLDVGCGAGVIGIAAGLFGAAEVMLVDANLLAIEVSARNLATHGIRGQAAASDVFSEVPDEKFDLIVSNPPFHHGKKVDYTVADALIDQAPSHLQPGGRLLVVANAFLNYDKRMQQVFRSVETIAATRQYHVLEAREPKTENSTR